MTAAAGLPTGQLTLAQRAALALVPPLAAALVRVAGATLRYEDRLALGASAATCCRVPSVYAFWHRSLLIAAHRFRDRGIAILISRSFDGELIARTVTRLAFAWCADPAHAAAPAACAAWLTRMRRAVDAPLRRTDPEDRRAWPNPVPRSWRS